MSYGRLSGAWHHIFGMRDARPDVGGQANAGDSFPVAVSPSMRRMVIGSADAAQDGDG
ncbi:MAG: hypothetical protein OXE76_09220 [Alphaproteobacteria bacterium]|nr:hypothetical protein [Alphaproteobacteria bacterium]